MKRYLRIVLKDRKYDLNLEIIRKLHIEYLKKINQKQNTTDNLQIGDVPPEEMTGYLFENNQYILRWIREHINWKTALNLLIITEEQWQESDIKIVYHKP